MEHHDSYDKDKRPLTRNEIDYIDATLLLPAASRCTTGGYESGQYVLRKEGELPVRVYEGVDYCPQFHSKVNNRANTWEYFVGMQARETTTFDNLSTYERDRLKTLFRQQYQDEGGEFANLSDDDEWQSLVQPEQYENVAIYLQTTMGCVFDQRSATRKYEVTRDVACGQDAKTRHLGSLSISSAMGEWTVGKIDYLSRRDATMLDMVAEDYSDITFDDMNQVVEILQVLNLVTPADYARFSRDIRL